MRPANPKPPAPKQMSVDQRIVALQAEIREIAARQMVRERANHTLQPTALVHEAYLKLCRRQDLEGIGRAQFLAAAAKAIQQVLIDHAKKRRAMKRGGDRDRVTLGDADPAAAQPPIDLLDLNKALVALERHSSRMHNVVVCRYFAGMTMKEIAEALDVGLRTVEDDWAEAKAWLRQELER